MTKKIAIIGCSGTGIGRSVLIDAVTKVARDVVFVYSNNLKNKDFVEINEADKWANILKTTQLKEIPPTDIQKSGKQARRERRKQLKNKKK